MTLHISLFKRTFVLQKIENVALVKLVLVKSQLRNSQKFVFAKKLNSKLNKTP